MRKHCTLLFLLSLCLSSYAQGIDLKADTWVASDALGRIMPTATNNPLRTDKTRTVGIFYITWHDEGKFGLRSPYGGDVTRTLKEAPEARLDAYHPAWKEWSLHWGEPEAGYFLSQDRWLIRRDLSMLADAGVDVLILDVTNAVLYWDEWNVLFDEMQKMRSLGNPVPQFCFWAFNGNVVSVVTQLFERIYKKGIAQDFWFQWQGKPLLLYNAEPDHDANGGGYDSGSYPQEIYDFFTLRNMWWGYYEWGGHRYVGTEDSWSFGYEMNVMRPPKGEFSEQTLALASQMGYRTCLWSFAYKDWDANAPGDTTQSLNKLNERLHCGAVYLLHAVSPTNAAILGDFIDYARSQGYEFVTP